MKKQTITIEITEEQYQKLLKACKEKKCTPKEFFITAIISQKSVEKLIENYGKETESF